MQAALREGYAPGHPGWEEFLLARAAVHDVRTLGETGEGLGSSVLLIRAAILLLTRARLARLGIDVTSGATGDEIWARLIELPTFAPLASELIDSQRSLLPRVLGVEGDMHLARDSESQRRSTLRTLVYVAEKLITPLEADSRRVHKVLVTRWLKIGVASLVALLALGSLWHKASARPNLALHRPVTVVTPHPTWGKEPGKLVDGDLNQMGFHTIEAPNQNVTIDLGGSHRISRVVVYNRTDCCQERAIPLRIEVSEDGKAYKKVAERHEPFPTEWTADFSSVKARYVRLTDLSAQAFHLNEVEVY